MCKPLNYTDMLVPWFEMQKILGVSGVTLYNHSMSHGTNQVVTHYAKQGFAQVISQGPIGKDTFRQPGSLSINDCLYRNMYTYQKLMVIDLDELIIPNYGYSIMNTLQYASTFYKLTLEKNHFKFASTTFFMDTADLSQPKNLPMLRHRYSGKPEPFQQGKCILDTGTCYFASVHACRKYLYPGSYSVRVNANIMKVHHYKRCYDNWRLVDLNDCENILKSLKQDNAILRYGGLLQERVQNTWHALGLLKL